MIHIERKAAGVTVLSFGGGQDSTAILYKLALDPVFRRQYAPGELLVVCSDTGDEHPETYAHLADVKAFCLEHGIAFEHLTRERGYHSGAWQGLREFYRAKNAIGSQAYPKTCTDNLKVQPIYRFIEEWLGRRYGFQTGKKRALYAYAKRFGKLRVLVGIAADEEKRIEGASTRSKWMSENVSREYPLVALGWNREKCIAYIRSIGRPVPAPSNCMLCPFKSPIEILWTARRYPADFAAWVELEARKIEANADRTAEDKNYGVYKLKRLPQVLVEAEAKFGHMTDAELDEYRFSHGHCVSSKF